MTSTVHRLATAFLRRAALLAGVLAIVAGIFGMHVMTGTHGTHSAAVTAPGGALPGSPAVAGGHAGHQAGSSPLSLRAFAGQDADAASGQACSCSGNCSSMQGMSVPCIPSAKSGSLAAPEPGTAGLALHLSGGFINAAAGAYSYLRGCPSPGELSISRT